MRSLRGLTHTQSTLECDGRENRNYTEYDKTEPIIISNSLEDITIKPYNKTNVKLNCGHIFHIECMRLWTISENPNSLKCPMCRGEIISRISYRF